MHRSLPWLVVSASLSLLVGCTGDDSAAGNNASDGGVTDSGDGDGGDGSIATGFSVRGSVQQIDVWKAPIGTTIQVQDSTGKVVTSAKTDSLGSIIFRKLAPGDYAVVGSDLTPPEIHKPIHVMGIPDSLPTQDFYTKQTLVPGFNYITTRDGTQLSAYVTFPGPAANGPYPTVVNYSGYNPSQPGAPINGFQGSAKCTTLPVLCDAPNDPSALIAALNGYATVGVNMRGTGCSGGAYDYFEDLQLLDGYDIIETVAAQSWAFNHKVGMTGLSYPGISQLFVAEQHPPSLAAITPLSVIGGTYSTARPGGIFNDGFALNWISSVVDKAAPYGQGWEQGLVDKGDKVCADNQLLHGQKVDAITEAQQTPYYTDDLVGRVDPTTFAHEINVPVFLGDGWQDEQTGPFFFTLLDQFTSAPIKRFTMYNGVHIDGFAPQMLVEWKAFLDIYVAHKVPVISTDVRSMAPLLFQQIFKESMQIPPDRFASYPTYEAAKAAYEAEDPYRVIFENGYGDTTKVGAPVGTADLRFASWPHPAMAAQRMYFETNGSLGAIAPLDAFAASSFTLDPDAGHRGILASGGDVWDPLPAYSWMQPAAGKDVVFESTALATDLVMLGSASADLWIRSPVDDADLEVNVMEIRPDGQEMFVQTGWLRASLRALATTATALWPEHTYRQADEALLVPGAWNLARVGIPAFQHTFRAGSKIRVTVDTPGDSRAAWTFDLKKYPTTVSYDVGHDATHSSSINFPVLGGLVSTTPMPPCPSLRGEQCRTYAAYTNVASSP